MIAILLKRLKLKKRIILQITFELSNYEINQNLADSQFSFTPPEGSKVIDLRQQSKKIPHKGGCLTFCSPWF